MTDPFTGLPMEEVPAHNEAMARSMYHSRRDRFEEWVSRSGARLCNLNDRLHGSNPSRWDRRTWRFVDRIAIRLFTFGER